MTDGFDWAGRRVLLTGASSGIGAALAPRLARAGAVLGLVARREAPLRDVLEECRVHSPRSQVFPCDLTDLDAVDRLAATALGELGGVDVLVNNAGMPKRRNVLQIDADTTAQVMHLNYVSPVRLTLALLPHMVERGSGTIVNVSSVAATLSSPGEGAYDASKAALSVWSEAAAIDLWDHGVRVHIVYPGVVDTPLFAIPDNDPLPAGITPIPVTEFIDGMLAGLDAGRLEIYVPGWFRDIVVRKAADVEAFVRGSVEYVRSQRG